MMSFSDVAAAASSSLAYMRRQAVDSGAVVCRYVHRGAALLLAHPRITVACAMALLAATFWLPYSSTPASRPTLDLTLPGDVEGGGNIGGKGTTDHGETTSWAKFFRGRPMFILGDSTVAAGNFMMTQFPYEVDLPAGSPPTGRFSNRFTIADYAAIQNGSPIPQVPLVNGSLGGDWKTSHGVNFASAGCGILNWTHPPEFTATVVTTNLPYCLLVFFKPNYRSLYARGARQFLINNIGPIGCIPNKRNRVRNPVTREKECDEELNKCSKEYNRRLEIALRGLAAEDQEATFVLADSAALFSDIINTPAKYGFTVTEDPCCGTWNPAKTMYLCSINSGFCSNRNATLFFDGAHASDEASRLFINSCFEGKICRKIM
ncbi:hypothetical protein Vadar_020536 [Vaccinium darrowii]|uniref:Uncharacterized protein n=1 Tax=Vaccinium darrowii TaxID=229202 RepID=A0ACB7Y176_9ERIC|nr:hypothetical protein Vadar_020536 [Vaccinium darrowii]